MTPPQAPLMAPLPDAGRYVLATDWHFEVHTTPVVRFTIPAGYSWDGASVPRFFHRVVTPFDPKVITAALEHDYLCDRRPECVNYKAAAWHFRTKLKVGRLRRQAMYLAVLHFGPRW